MIVVLGAILPLVTIQVAALQAHYDSLTPDEKRLAKADYVGLTVIPAFAMVFVASYWTIGMMKYNSPDWSAYTFLIPSFQVYIDIRMIL